MNIEQVMRAIKPKSQQQKWQERMVAQGRCRVCGKPRSKQNKSLCPKHRLKHIEYMKKGNEKRRKNK